MIVTCTRVSVCVLAIGVGDLAYEHGCGIPSRWLTSLRNWQHPKTRFPRLNAYQRPFYQVLLILSQRGQNERSHLFWQRVSCPNLEYTWTIGLRHR